MFSDMSGFYPQPLLNAYSVNHYTLTWQ